MIPYWTPGGIVLKTSLSLDPEDFGIWVRWGADSHVEGTAEAVGTPEQRHNWRKLARLQLGFRILFWCVTLEAFAWRPARSGDFDRDDFNPLQ